jgi:hypothetical protein
MVPWWKLKSRIPVVGMQAAAKAFDVSIFNTGFHLDELMPILYAHDMKLLTLAA